MKKNLVFKAAIVFAASTALLAGCSAPSVEPTPTPTPSPSETFEAKTPAQALEDFRAVAAKSCETALAQGVVEESTGAEGFKLVMVPKAEAYKDYSAAYFAPPKTYELIWETDALSACGADIQFAMAEEGGGTVDLEVSYSTEDGTYTTTQDLGEQGIWTLNYEVAEGLFSTVTTLRDGEEDPRTIRYGNLTDADWAILKTAVDAFLAEQ